MHGRRGQRIAEAYRSIRTADVPSTSIRCSSLSEASRSRESLAVLFTALFFVVFGLIARYIPPPAPTRAAADVASVYRDNANAIRTGMILSMYALALFVPFAAAISVQLKRIEGEHTPLTYAQLGISCTLPVAFFPALYDFQYLQVAAYRPERSEEAIQTLNGMGWLPFTGIIYAIFVQNLVTGVAVLSDHRAQPVYPRW